MCAERGRTSVESAFLVRKIVSTGTQWELAFGYSRALRAGAHVYVAGTTAVDESGAVIGGDDPYAQAAAVLRKIEAALTQAGASLRAVRPPRWSKS